MCHLERCYAQWGTFKIKGPYQEPFLGHVKSLKTSFSGFLKIISSNFYFRSQIFNLIFIMGFNFNDNKIFVPFKTIK
jgi:hypothetical protein